MPHRQRAPAPGSVSALLGLRRGGHGATVWEHLLLLQLDHRLDPGCFHPQL